MSNKFIIDNTCQHIKKKYIMGGNTCLKPNYVKIKKKYIMGGNTCLKPSYYQKKIKKFVARHNPKILTSRKI